MRKKSKPPTGVLAEPTPPLATLMRRLLEPLPPLTPLTPETDVTWLPLELREEVARLYEIELKLRDCELRLRRAELELREQLLLRRLGVDLRKPAKEIYRSAFLALAQETVPGFRVAARPGRKVQPAALREHLEILFYLTSAQLEGRSVSAASRELSKLSRRNRRQVSATVIRACFYELERTGRGFWLICAARKALKDSDGDRDRAERLLLERLGEQEKGL